MVKSAFEKGCCTNIYKSEINPINKFDRYIDSFVYIKIENDQYEENICTGCFIHKSGLILTSAHPFMRVEKTREVDIQNTEPSDIPECLYSLNLINYTAFTVYTSRYSYTNNHDKKEVEIFGYDTSVDIMLLKITQNNGDFKCLKIGKQVSNLQLYVVNYISIACNFNIIGTTIIDSRNVISGINVLCDTFSVYGDYYTYGTGGVILDSNFNILSIITSGTGNITSGPSFTSISKCVGLMCYSISKNINLNPRQLKKIYLGVSVTPKDDYYEILETSRTPFYIYFFTENIIRSDVSNKTTLIIRGKYNNNEIVSVWVNAMVGTDNLSLSCEITQNLKNAFSSTTGNTITIKCTYEDTEMSIKLNRRLLNPPGTLSSIVERINSSGKCKILKIGQVEVGRHKSNITDPLWFDNNTSGSIYIEYIIDGANGTTQSFPIKTYESAFNESSIESSFNESSIESSFNESSIESITTCDDYNYI